MAFEESKVEANINAIDAVEKSRSIFSKRDQSWADRVRRFQHVAAFPEDSTM